MIGQGGGWPIGGVARPIRSFPNREFANPSSNPTVREGVDPGSPTPANGRAYCPDTRLLGGYDFAVDGVNIDSFYRSTNKFNLPGNMKLQRIRFVF